MPKLHFPGPASPTPQALSIPETRNALLALIVESLQGIEESLYPLGEYFARKGIAEGVFTKEELEESEAKDAG
jgi:hypothetical protein